MRRLNIKHSTLALAIGGLLTLTSFAEQSHANESKDAERQGLPGRRISGGSRSINTACLATPSQPVVAIMPKSNVGMTLSERPTLWFSLPAINTDRSLEFGLYDSAGELVYQETFQATGEAGLSSLSLPTTFRPLSAEENYQWYLSVVCNPDSRSEDLVVTGWIRRMQADRALQAQLADATAQERLSIYETSNLWFDTLATLAEIRDQAQPNSPLAQPVEQQINTEWLSLLESIDLAQVATTSFISEPILQ